MNYHIITQDKFFCQYIEDIYTLGLEKNNTILVRGEKKETPYFSTQRPVIYLGEDRKHIITFFQTISKTDKLIVNAYDSYMAGLILEARITCSVYVHLMGYEVYSEPIEWHASWLFDRRTHVELQKCGVLRSLWYNPHHNNIFRHLSLFCKAYFHKRKLFKIKDKTIGRIDYIISDDEQIALLRKLYPSFRAQKAELGFLQNFDEALQYPLKVEPRTDFKILVGNSSDPTNNHADAYHFIKKNCPEENYNIHSFLSYGSENGKSIALHYGQQYFGERFVPIVSFMSRQQFLDYVYQMDIVFMYHNRQQAFGNIVTAIAMGKPVFMKKRNVIYQALINLGIKGIYDVESMSSHPLNFFISEAQSCRGNNSKLLYTYCSTERRLENYKRLLS